ncbi:ABC transporter permease [Halodesulfovibrio marinisediminis]|uniref:ABC-2 type transport system permease protein n=1 Tax=Halodesulfovibrio marinisediminis DSM 17456 TaxID=1121457 RepID=A0A1N6J9Z7_9BACT|nr:ABC transporter permease [Halodesulfovibrio marinisediminis]SIO41150.1 ABC-2 type transport system permease protein [Halodesulfovibrio marinisediminis DSM 17456]
MAGLSYLRLRGFIRKELLQIKRDPSSILLGIVMPVVLLLIFGYGVSLEPNNVPIAIVVDSPSQVTQDLKARFQLSRYFSPVTVHSMSEAVQLMQTSEVDCIIHVRSNFLSLLLSRQEAPIQLILNGIDANRARIIEGYIQNAIGLWAQRAAMQAGVEYSPPIMIESRIWFNAAATSTYSLIPGLLTLIMTLIGTQLTALVIAREWERGTMEALLSTPIRSNEILLGKLVPYYGLGMIGMGFSILLGVFLFDVPLRGSVFLLFLLGSVFLLASLGFGLFISSAARIQFVAAMGSVLSAFLPAFFLSGLMFDLKSTPKAVQYISTIVPAKYFVTITQTLFLAGNVWSVLIPASLVLVLMSVVLLLIARKKLGRRLPQ